MGVHRLGGDQVEDVLSDDNPFKGADVDAAITSRATPGDVSAGAYLARSARASFTPDIFEDFEAWTKADLQLPFTTTSGPKATRLGVDGLPSAIQIDSGAVDGNVQTERSDPTVSLVGLGGTTILFETRAKISQEANAAFRMGLVNMNADRDEAEVVLDTEAASVDVGAVRAWVDGADTVQEVDLVGNFDLTVYHTYRLEVVPGGSVELFVDDVSQGQVGIAPVDMPHRIQLESQEAGGTATLLDVDYVAVGST